MIKLRLLASSIYSRKITVLLSIASICISVSLVIGIEKLRTSAKKSFTNTISATDVIVGTRSGNIQLLLYTVFGIGNATNNITWTTYKDISKRPEVEWAIPLSLGDSHKGFRVLGTTKEFFEHYRYRQKKPLAFKYGKPFAKTLDTVIGSDVASTLGYNLGDAIVVSHGIGKIETNLHDDQPFTVVGILQKTGTPVDKTVHVSLQSIEAIHKNWKGGRRLKAQDALGEVQTETKFVPREITGALVGLKSRIQIFQFQRYINNYRHEALSAILPGVALQELWSLISTAETALIAISTIVVMTSFLGMITMILATLNERRREMAILRAIGASPAAIAGLMIAEASLIILAGIISGFTLIYAGLVVFRSTIDQISGIYIDIGFPTDTELFAVIGIFIIGCLCSLIPAWRAYLISVTNGFHSQTG